MRSTKLKIAVLDDYQNVAATMADWSWIESHAEVRFFTDHVAKEDEVVRRLEPFDIVCVMRERTPLTAERLAKLPNLKLIVSTGRRNASIDLKAAEARGIPVMNTGYSSAPTIEFTWSLILGLARQLPLENASLRNGGWQTQVGTELHGRTLALLGLGNIGTAVARIASAFGMKVIAWSENLTPDRAQENGAEWVSKEELFRRADFLSIHLVLSDRSRGLVDKKHLGLMKRTAYFINTSRGPIVDSASLLEALSTGSIAGAAVDVYDEEPLPLNHPFRTAPRLLATPHLGFVTDTMYRTFYGDTVANVRTWMEKNRP